jgi:hypothetical protein
VKSPGRNSKAEKMTIETANKVIKPSVKRVKIVFTMGCKLEAHNQYLRIKKAG